MVARVRVVVGWVASVATLACIASCASGFDNDPEADGWSNFGSAGHAPASASGTGGHVAAGAMFTGESCSKPGDSGLCECEKPGSQGMRVCRMDAKSPTGASWGPCGTCVDAPPPKFDPETASSGATGGREFRGGLGGIGGLAGSSASGSGGAAAMSSGSGGMRGSGRDRNPASGGASCACDDTVCFPVGILPCCRIDGSCGCTWAPGAYCL